jgi:hypothetical protein
LLPCRTGGTLSVGERGTWLGKPSRTAGRSLEAPVGHGGSSITPAGSQALCPHRIRAGESAPQLIADPTRGREHIEPTLSESTALHSTRLQIPQCGAGDELWVAGVRLHLLYSAVCCVHYHSTLAGTCTYDCARATRCQGLQALIRPAHRAQSRPAT